MKTTGGSSALYGDKCPFARNPDLCGCDCTCTIPRPKGVWNWIKGLFGPSWRWSGMGGCGDGSLPCHRYDKWMREHEELEIARRFFDEVASLVEAGCDDVIYDVIDPEQADEGLCSRFSLDTIMEVLSLGFRKKYGAEWRKGRGGRDEK